MKDTRHNFNPADMDLGPTTMLDSMKAQARESRFRASRQFNESSTADNELVCLVCEARIEALDEAGDLVADMKRLAESLMREAAKIEQAPLSGHTNSLGVVQGSGLDIDRRCAILRERLASFRVLARAAKKFVGEDGISQ